MNPYITQKDSFDAADAIYQPPLLNLPRVSAPTSLHRRLLGDVNEYVRDQGSQPYCTAMALASVIDYLVLQRDAQTSEYGSNISEPSGHPTDMETRCSARMLYEMAKAFDEYPDDDNKGSSLRGAIKGFFHNGVYRRPHNDRTEMSEWHAPGWFFDISKAKQSRQTVLGRYARVGPSLLDYQSAIAHVGIVYVSAAIHSGWELNAVQDNRGAIKYVPSQSPLGNHAFAIIGYNESGFLVLNSAGISWGCWSDPLDPESGSWPSVGLWSYEDWGCNILDAWVMRLGVAIETEQFRRLDPGRLDNTRWGGFTGQGVTRLFVNGHYLHIADGQLASNGVFTNNQASIVETASLLEKTFPDKVAHRPVRKYSDLVLFVESGLESMDSMIRRCASYAVRLLGESALIDQDFRPYPISVIWRKDVLQLTEDLLASRAKRIEARTGGYADAKAHMLDAYAREFLQPIWRTFEGEAERSFTSNPGESRGQAWSAMQVLLAAAASGDTPMGVHFIVHGSGMPWFQALVQRIADNADSDPATIPGLHTPELRRRILRSITLLAPICTVERVQELLVKLWGDWTIPSGPEPRPLAIYVQPTTRDAEENLGGYGGSFLELARRCFPLDGNLPTVTNPNNIAGHSEGVANLKKHLDRSGLIEFINVETLPTTGHADLMADANLIQAVFQRIRARSINASSSNRE